MSNPIKSEPKLVDLKVGDAIRIRRKRLGISQGTLADAIGVTFQQVQKYERGSNRVSASALFDIATALHCAPGDFFPESLEPTTEIVGDFITAATQIHGRKPGLVEKLAILPKHTLATFESLANDILGKAPAQEAA